VHYLETEAEIEDALRAGESGRPKGSSNLTLYGINTYSLSLHSKDSGSKYCLKRSPSVVWHPPFHNRATLQRGSTWFQVNLLMFSMRGACVSVGTCMTELSQDGKKEACDATELLALILLPFDLVQ
jgi:hypothetical protein